MIKIEKIKDNITYIGSQDPNLKIFDIVMETKFGTTYNSYLIDGGSEFALIDTAKEKYFDEYIEKLKTLCDISKIKYLIVNHTEPDHSGEIHKLLDIMPHLTIVGTSNAIGFLKDISNKEFSYLEVKEGFSLEVGDKKLNFIIAPNLHWPDSMFTYIKEDNIIFTCDVFGAHYNTNNVFDNSVENKENYLEAFEYYYNAIFSPFKPFVLSGLRKIKNSKLKLDLICPSHGPVIKEGIDFVQKKYEEWSKEVGIKPNKITIAYVSAYGYTGKLAEEIKSSIEKQGFEVSIFDLVNSNIDEVLHSIRESSGFLIGSPTLNSDTLPQIWDLLLNLSPYDCCGKIAGAFGAMGWSGEAVKNIESRLSMLKCDVFRPGLRIKFNPNYSDEKLQHARIFGDSFANKVITTNQVCDSEWVEFKTGKWKCLVCGEIFEGEYPPETCPVCGAPQDQFVEVDDEKINFSSNTAQKIIILGGGIAAISSIESIRARDKTCEIEMYSDEEELPYYRILLSKKLHCEISGIEYLKDKEWFEKNNVKYFLKKKAINIDPSKKIVYFEDKQEAHFDKLIIATGARAFKREIYGDDKNGVFCLRNKKDFCSINKFANQEHIKDIVVIGGGILGVEMASSLRALNKNVTIVEFAPRIMVKILDENGSKLFQKHLENNHIKILTNEIVEEIYGTGEGFKQTCGIKLGHSGDKLDCQMVIFATGIRPNIEFLKNSGINFHKGIIVNEYMQTNFENIFACGDVAEFNSKCIGLWSIAISQAKVAGACCVGDFSKKYEEKPIATSFNGFSYKIFSIGDLGYENNSNEYQILELNDPINKSHRKFYFYKNSFVGGILMGDTSKAVQLRKAITKGSNIQNFLDEHFLDE